MKKSLFLMMALLSWGALSAQTQPENSDDRVACYRMMSGVRKVISIPDIDGYKTFKCDFHTHTVYADAHVSPEGRVQEDWYDGLDVMAMTEHVGVHKTGIDMPDRNVPIVKAKAEGAKFGMIVIPGVEITRAKPFGHMNFLFVKDANVFSEDRYLTDKDGEYLTDELGRKINNDETLQDDIAAALEQDCFIQWNHPGWPDRKCDMYDIHKDMLAKGQIHAVEICNHQEWYPKVLDWFDEYHIPMTANTDQHSPIDYNYGHVIRPMTLVFAKEYTMESIREAMFAGRMVAFWDQTLAGDATWLEQLVHHSLQVRVIDAAKGRIEVTNISDIRFETMYGSHMNPVILYPRSAIIMTVKKGQKIEFLNCYTGRQHLHTNLW
jgi:predicted metal-dependent phosphoesterase TrpH